MKSLNINKKWNTGCGVSNKDLYPVKVELVDSNLLVEMTFTAAAGEKFQS